MDDVLNNIRRKIAYKVWSVRGGSADANWDYAGKVLHHYLDRHPEEDWWVQEEEDYNAFQDIIYGGD